MRSAGKIWFFGVSLFYAALAYFLGGASTTDAVSLFKSGKSHDGWGLNDPTFQVGGVVWASLVVLIQLYRIFCSVGRKREAALKPLRWNMLSFQTGGQGKFIVLLMIIPAVCWIVRLISRMQ
jgi:hypothetical protein